MTLQSQIEDYLTKQETSKFLNQSTPIMNTYSSVVPSEMTRKELRSMCGDVQTAKNWGLRTATVKLTNGLEYKVPVDRLKDYRDAYSTAV